MPPGLFSNLYCHSYDLSSLSWEYKKFVLDNVGKVLVLQPFNLVEKQVLCSLYSGFTTSDLSFSNKYFDDVYLPYYKDKVFASPRGYLGDDSILVVGIAPGESSLSYHEPNWLHGPSSKLLHSLLHFGYRWYFTNVCKQSFPGNEYNVDMIRGDQVRFDMEFGFFKNHKVIFLGNYDAYSNIINRHNLLPSQFLRIPHPSYLCRRSSKEVDDTLNMIVNFLGKESK